MKKLVSLLLAAMLLLTCLPMAMADEKPSLSVAISLNQSTNDDNTVIRKMRELTGVDLDITIYSDDDYDSKIATLTASKTLPDVFYLDWVKTCEYADAGLIIPLDELLEQYGTNFTSNQDYADMLALSKHNGKIYALTNYGFVFANGLVIRKDWLDELNLKVPETVEEYYEALKAIKAAKPNSIPYGTCFGYFDPFGQSTGCFNGIFNAFGVALGRGNLVDGKVLPSIMHPNFIRAIEFLRKLYQEDLMEKDFATIDFVQCVEKLWNGVSGSLTMNAQAIYNNWISRYVDEGATFTTLKLSSDYSQGGFENSGYAARSGGFVVSSKCKNPEEAIKLLNMLFTHEGNMLVYYGVEGVHYEMVDGKVQYLGEYQTAATHRLDGGFVYQGMMLNPDNVEYQTMSDAARREVEFMREYPLENAVAWMGGLEIEAEVGSLLDDIIEECIATLIVTDGDVEAKLQEFVNNWLSAGGNEWIDQATAAYQETLID